MNNIKTSDINDGLGIEQPFTGRSLAFLQNANKEMVAAICRSIMGEYYYSLSGTQGVAITGLMFSNTFANIFEGYVFFSGELYYCRGAFGLNAPPYTSPGNTPVFTASNTNDPTADPLTFTDGFGRNVHTIRQVAITAGATGSGLFDLSNLIQLGNPKNSISGFPTVIPVADYPTTTGSPEAITGATFTSPSYKASYQITFECDAEWAVTSGQLDGAIVAIYSGVTALHSVRVTNDYATATGVQRAPISITAYLKDTVAGTVFTAKVTRVNAADVTVENCQMVIKRILN